VKGGESYNFLSEGLAPVWQDVRAVLKHPAITIDRQFYILNIIYGADYKVIEHDKHQLHKISTCKLFCSCSAADGAK